MNTLVLTPSNNVQTSTASVAASPKFYFPEIDGLRLIAFLLVFFHHAALPNFSLLGASPMARGISISMIELNANGWVGVDLFFVNAQMLGDLFGIHEFFGHKASFFDPLILLDRPCRVKEFAYQFLLIPTLHKCPLFLGVAIEMFRPHNRNGLA